ncbi:MAG: hypothetical protein KUG77_05695 [Nannocystaceae bacterium]|nr:hypothetical protein [Nannocystaceae bacterium]
MRMRVALALSLALPALVAWVAVGMDPGLMAGAWWVPAAAAVVALLWLCVLRRSVVLLVVAGGLAALGAHSSAKARAMLDVASAGDFPFYDLRSGGIPDPVPPYARVSGFVRSGWTLDEYAVEPGELPDQSADPIAVLIPVVGAPAVAHEDDAQPKGNAIEPGVAVVVARVSPSALFDASQPTSLEGKTEPLDPDLLGTLVQVQGDPAQIHGVLLDTLAVPSRQDAWLELGLGFIALLTAMVCGFVAAAPRSET